MTAFSSRSNNQNTKTPEPHNQIRPTRPPRQTLAQARAEFKKHGPRISSQEQRRLDRGAELFKRAEKIKLAEQRKKLAKEKRALKEEKEREAKKGIITIPKIAASQKILDGLGWGLKTDKNKSVEWVNIKEEQIAIATTEEEIMDMECYLAGEKYPGYHNSSDDADEMLVYTMGLGPKPDRSDSAVTEPLEKQHQNTALEAERTTRKTNSCLAQEESGEQQSGKDHTKSSINASAGGNSFSFSDEELDDGSLLEVAMSSSIPQTSNTPVKASTPEGTFGPCVVDRRGDKPGISSSTEVLPEPWDEFLLSSTQIERVILETPPKPPPQYLQPCTGDPFDDLLSTQDLAVTFDDGAANEAQESSLPQTMNPVGQPLLTLQVSRNNSRDSILMPPPAMKPSAPWQSAPDFRSAAASMSGRPWTTPKASAAAKSDTILMPPTPMRPSATRQRVSASQSNAAFVLGRPWKTPKPATVMNKDTMLMPPPKLPTVRKQVTKHVSPVFATSDPILLDFPLSTQDLGDFGC